MGAFSRGSNMETRSVELNICQTCNWACPSCNRFCDVFHDTAVDTVMTVAEVDGILDEINNNNELQVGTFTIIGGEPTLHPDCEAICRLVCKKMASTSKRIAIATNNSRPDVVSRLRAIPGLNIRIDDVRGASSKSDKHWNCYDLSNAHNGNGFDFRKCGWYRFGIGIHKHHGKVRWFHCCHAQFVARLLDIEDDVAAFSLHDLLTNDRSTQYNSVICRHCVIEPQNRPKSRDFRVVSREFAPGYARILQEAKALSRWHIGDFRLGGAYAVCYTGNMRRHDALMLELERVGLTAEVVWSFPTPYKKFLLSKIPHIAELDTHPGSWGATLCHYEAIKLAYVRGQDNVLIVEDDCRFLKDVDAVNRGLMAAPPDWDILMLDHWGHPKPGDNPYPVVAGWMRVGEANSTACYVLRRKAMERLIDMYESPVSGKYPNPMMRNSDTWLSHKYLGRDVVIQVAVPNLAVQQYCGDTSNWGGMSGMCYAKLGVDRSLYAGGAKENCASQTGAFASLRSAVEGASKVYLWSNASPHSSLEEYAKALDAVTFDAGAVHIMINSCMPLRANAHRFDGLTCYSVNRQLGSLASYHGSSEFNRFRSRFAGSFIVTDAGMLFDCTSVPSCGMSAYLKRLPRTAGVCKAERAPESPVFSFYGRGLIPEGFRMGRFGPTTGFMAYLLAKAVGGVDKVVLCNFSIRDSGYSRMQSVHGDGVDDECSTYASDGCSRLTV